MARFNVGEKVRVKATGEELIVAVSISTFEGGTNKIIYELSDGKRDVWGTYISNGVHYNEADIVAVDARRDVKLKLVDELSRLTHERVAPYLAESETLLKKEINRELVRQGMLPKYPEQEVERQIKATETPKEVRKPAGRKPVKRAKK